MKSIKQLLEEKQKVLKRLQTKNANSSATVTKTNQEDWARLSKISQQMIILKHSK